MKTRILAIAVIATAAIAGWNYNQNQKSVELTDVALENVEALASCEQLLGTCWYTPWDNRCCDGGVNGCAPCD